MFTPFRVGKALRVPAFLVAVALSLLTAAAHAQVTVDLLIKRRIFMLNEPVIATVAITNQTGGDIMLADTEGRQWFSFQIVSGDRTIQPRDPNYELQPLPIRSGETVRRSVNLNELYELNEYGPYRAAASIYVPSIGKWFTSRPDPFELTEGRLLWKQTVGVPDSPEGTQNNRTFSLLTLDQPKGRMLYVRVVGTEDGNIYGCYNLGRLLEGFQPDAKFDSANNLAVLQPVARKEYLLSRVGVQGAFLGQNTYTTVKGQPYLRRLGDGALQIVGATRHTPVSPAALEDAPKLSDRPPGFPR
jgi:hypothetical protein